MVQAKYTRRIGTVVVPVEVKKMVMRSEVVDGVTREVEVEETSVELEERTVEIYAIRGGVDLQALGGDGPLASMAVKQFGPAAKLVHVRDVTSSIEIDIAAGTVKG
jgi:hypothetical protein